MTTIAVVSEHDTSELSSAVRHALAGIIIEQDGVTYEQALVQVEALAQDLANPGFLAAVLQPSGFGTDRDR